MMRSPLKTYSALSQTLTTAIGLGLNILLVGPPGGGKTSCLAKACKELDLRMAYFSTPTLDPFADLVGIPVPQKSGDSYDGIQFLRPKNVTQAEVMFFDELNRATSKVTNAVFEITQFRSINGESLPHLKSVVAAINPPSAGVMTNELDSALIDRFHVILKVDFPPNREWFTAKFGKRLANAVIDWHQVDLDDDQRSLISNRRLDYIAQALQASLDPALVCPPDQPIALHLLVNRLTAISVTWDVEDFVREPARFADLVKTDLEVAQRFADLLPHFRPEQKFRAHGVLLALPAEVLASLKSKHPFVFRQTEQSIQQFGNPADADAFRNLVEERLESTR